MKKSLEIVLVGTGFYVCGKNKKEYGIKMVKDNFNYDILNKKLNDVLYL